MKSNCCLSVVLAFALTACGGGGGGNGPVATPVAVNNTPVARVLASSTASVGQVITLDGSGSIDPSGGVLTYKWTMTSTPTGSAVRFSDTDTAKPQLTNTIAGNYVATLIVNNGKLDSAPVTISFTVNTINGGASPRAPIAAEIKYLTDTAQANILVWLKSPSTFKLAEASTWTYYDTIGKPDQGAIVFKFDSQNGFGAMIRTTAICPANWDARGYWVNTIQNSLALCVFI